MSRDGAAAARHDEHMDAAQWLRSARWARRISQRELAELADLPRSTVDRIESGRTVPRFDTFTALLAAVGYEIRVVDRHGRELGRTRSGNGPPSYIDRGGRQFPAHLPARKTPRMGDGPVVGVLPRRLVGDRSGGA